MAADDASEQISAAIAAEWSFNTLLPITAGQKLADPGEIVDQYLQKTPPGLRAVNLGCGGQTFPGWLNIDEAHPHHADLVWDLTRGLPFLPEGQFDAFFSEHFLEHIPRQAAIKLLGDGYRALKPGGHIRIALPNLDDLARMYNEGEKLHLGDESFGLGAVFHTRCEHFNVAMRA